MIWLEVSIAQSRKALLPLRHGDTVRKIVFRFQSLSREKPFCHFNLGQEEGQERQVSIAQSRKALLPCSKRGQ